MKVLLIRTSSAENTIFKNIYNEQEVGLAKALTRLDHECGIVYYARKGNASQQEVDVDGKKIKIYNIEGKEFCKSAIYNKKIYDLCEEYDIIQVYECDKVMTWLINSKYSYKTIIYHGPYQSRFTWKHNLYAKVFYKIFLKRNNYLNAHIITKSYLAEEYLKKQGFKNVHTIGVGLDTSKFVNKIDDVSDNIDFFNKIKKENKHLLYIGKIEPRRNIKFLIDLLSDLIKENDNIKLVIVGNGNSKYIKRMVKYARNKNVLDSIIYEKSINHNSIQALYEKCDIFLLPTQYEIFGMVLLEAMYFGIPTITTLNGGSSVLIENGKNGYISNLKDKNGWIEIITKLLSDKQFSNDISKKSMDFIKQYYIWKKLSKEFLNIYKEIVKNKKILKEEKSENTKDKM